MSMAPDVDTVVEIHRNKGGTYVRTGHDGERILLTPSEHSEGFYVAIDQIAIVESLVELQDLQCPRSIVLEPEKYMIGFWYSEETNLWFVDKVIHVEHQIVAEAIALDRGENSIFDIKNNVSIKVEPN